MLDNAEALKTFQGKLQDNGFTISALSCHGNPLHPDPEVRKGYQADESQDHSACGET